MSIWLFMRRKRRGRRRARAPRVRRQPTRSKLSSAARSDAASPGRGSSPTRARSRRRTATRSSARRRPGIVGRPDAASRTFRRARARVVRSRIRGREERRTSVRPRSTRTARRAPSRRRPCTARTSSIRCSSVGRPPTAIGEPGPALVEEDQPREGREPAEEARVARLLPRQLEVGDPARDKDEVERAVADDLIGDVDVAAPGVARLRRLRTAYSLHVSRNALQLVLAALLELDAGAGDEVLDGARDEHLARSRPAGDPRADVAPRSRRPCRRRAHTRLCASRAGARGRAMAPHREWRMRS